MPTYYTDQKPSFTVSLGMLGLCVMPMTAQSATLDAVQDNGFKGASRQIAYKSTNATQIKTEAVVKADQSLQASAADNESSVTLAQTQNMTTDSVPSQLQEPTVKNPVDSLDPSEESQIRIEQLEAQLVKQQQVLVDLQGQNDQLIAQLKRLQLSKQGTEEIVVVKSQAQAVSFKALAAKAVSGSEPILDASGQEFLHVPHNASQAAAPIAQSSVQASSQLLGETSGKQSGEKSAKGDSWHHVVYIFHNEADQLQAWSQLDSLQQGDKWQGKTFDQQRQTHRYFIYVGAYKDINEAKRRQRELKLALGVAPITYAEQAQN